MVKMTTLYYASNKYVNKHGNAEFAGVDKAGVDKSAIWVLILGYF